LTNWSVDNASSVLGQKFAIQFLPHSPQKSPLPLPSTLLRACFAKEGLKFHGEKLPPLKKFEKGGQRGI
jgi:hypothetical protein